jgi:tetratricopeptide (TPR) repeat protein
MKTNVALATSIVLGLALARPAMAFQADPKEEARPAIQQAPSVQEIRTAYTEGRDKDVLLLTERALLAATNRGDLDLKGGELYFWKGAALRRLGRSDEAVIALDQSKALGFSAPQVYMEHGLASRTLGDSQEADRDYQEAEKRLPEDPSLRDLFLKHWKWDGTDQPRFQLWLSPEVGWDSNVIGLRSDTPLLEGKPNFESYYYGAYLDARYYLVQNQRQLVWLEYQLLARDYPQETAVSFLDNVGSIAGRQPLTDWADFEIRGSLEEAFLRDTGHFRGQEAIAPALLLQATHDLQVKVWGDWTHATYYEKDVPEPQDRSGNITRGGVVLAIDLGMSWTLAPYGTLNKVAAKGSDYDAHGWETGVTVTSPEVAGFRVTMVAFYGEEDYTNLNSIVNFTEKRLDRPWGGTLTITLKHIEKWLGYAPSLSVGFVRHSSNIAEFSYSRWTPQLEVSLGILSF